jgi:hypothetical protein
MPAAETPSAAPCGGSSVSGPAVVQLGVGPNPVSHVVAPPPPPPAHVSQLSHSLTHDARSPAPNAPRHITLHRLGCTWRQSSFTRRTLCGPGAAAATSPPLSPPPGHRHRPEPGGNPSTEWRPPGHPPCASRRIGRSATCGGAVATAAGPRRPNLRLPAAASASRFHTADLGAGPLPPSSAGRPGPPGPP